MKSDTNYFIAKDGTMIHYVDIGQGKPLIFVHGFGSAAEAQIPFFESVKDNFRCICIDQRGYGKTAGSGKIGIHQSARDISDLLQNLEIDNAVFIGYSMGGAVMFSYIEQFGCAAMERYIIGDMTPKLVSEDGWDLGLYQGWYTRDQYELDLKNIAGNYDVFSLFLTEQLLIPSYPENKRDFSRGVEELRNQIKILTIQSGFAIENALLNISEEQKKTNYCYWKDMGEADFRTILKNITVPVGIIYGDPGSIYSPATAKYMAKIIPNATLYPMNECTHLAITEKPDLFKQYIYEFCNINGKKSR